MSDRTLSERPSAHLVPWLVYFFVAQSFRALLARRSLAVGGSDRDCVIVFRFSAFMADVNPVDDHGCISWRSSAPFMGPRNVDVLACGRRRAWKTFQMRWTISGAKKGPPYSMFSAYEVAMNCPVEESFNVTQDGELRLLRVGMCARCATLCEKKVVEGKDG